MVGTVVAARAIRKSVKQPDDRMVFVGENRWRGQGIDNCG
jgi:hypothetical protein